MRVLLILLATAAVVWALVECIQADEDQVRNLPKIGWILVILFGYLFGAVAWFLLGRPRVTQLSRPGPGAAGSRPATAGEARRLAPDDDPDFLRRIGRDSEHEQMLKRWEEDLRRRERELRDPDDPEGGDGGIPPH